MDNLEKLNELSIADLSEICKYLRKDIKFWRREGRRARITYDVKNMKAAKKRAKHYLRLVEDVLNEKISSYNPFKAAD